MCSGDTVWLPHEGTEASVIEKNGPRSYSIATPNGTLQRNRSQIRAMPRQDERPQIDTSMQGNNNANRTESTGSGTEANENSPDLGLVITEERNNKIMKTSSGRISRPPKRYGEEL